VDETEHDYPWLGTRDDQFTLALVLDVGEVLSRRGYPAPTGATLVDLTAGLYRALHPTPTGATLVELTSGRYRALHPTPPYIPPSFD
jgi:hypothetical protein